MEKHDPLASILADFIVVDALMPWPCPSDFGLDRRYLLLELVGSGRDSLVYKAKDRRLSSDGFEAIVAIKVMRSTKLDTREALAIRRVTHDHVLKVLDHGMTDDGHTYVVMEYIAGNDLSTMTVPMPPRAAAMLMSKICRAVQSVHSAGLVHCDLKPSNVMMTDKGEPKLVDFELARWMDDADGRARGNAAFMSPEQATGQADALTPPSDIYALGGLLYWMLAGKTPNGMSQAEVSDFHASESPAPDPLVGGDLRQLCRHAMARLRSDRYHSAGEFADDLDRWLRHEPIPSLKPSALRRTSLWARRRPAVAVASAALVLGTSGLGGVMLYNNVAEARREVRTQTEAAKLARMQRDQMSDRMAKQLRWFFELTKGTEASGDVSLVPTGLLWMNWMARWPQEADDGRIFDIKPRIEVLRRMVDSQDGYGLPMEQLDGMLARHTLAYSLVEAGVHDEPLDIVAQIEHAWRDQLAKDDPLWRSIDMIRKCSAALAESPDPVKRKAAIVDLELRIRDLGNDISNGPAARLAERTRNRLVRLDERKPER